MTVLRPARRALWSGYSHQISKAQCLATMLLTVGLNCLVMLSHPPRDCDESDMTDSRCSLRQDCDRQRYSMVLTPFLHASVVFADSRNDCTCMRRGQAEAEKEKDDAKDTR